jgi:hypothetical protein
LTSSSSAHTPSFHAILSREVGERLDIRQIYPIRSELMVLKAHPIARLFNRLIQTVQSID